MLCPSAHSIFQFQFIHQSSCSRYLNAVNAQKPTAATADPQLTIQLLIRISLYFHTLFHPQIGSEWPQMAPDCTRLVAPTRASVPAIATHASFGNRRSLVVRQIHRQTHKPPYSAPTVRTSSTAHQPPPPSANVVHHLQAACPHLIRYRFPGKWRLFPAASPQSHRGSWRLHVSTNSTTLFFSLDLC